MRMTSSVARFGARLDVLRVRANQISANWLKQIYFNLVGNKITIELLFGLKSKVSPLDAVVALILLA